MILFFANGDTFIRFYQCTSGIPYYINIFARFLPKNCELTEKMLCNSFDDNIEFIVIHLIKQLAKLITRQKDIIFVLMECPLSRIEIARKLNIQSGFLSNYLVKLQNLGMIAKNNSKF